MRKSWAEATWSSGFCGGSWFFKRNFRGKRTKNSQKPKLIQIVQWKCGAPNSFEVVWTMYNWLLFVDSALDGGEEFEAAGVLGFHASRPHRIPFSGPPENKEFKIIRYERTINFSHCFILMVGSNPWVNIEPQWRAWSQHQRFQAWRFQHGSVLYRPNDLTFIHLMETVWNSWRISTEIPWNTTINSKTCCFTTRKKTQLAICEEAWSGRAGPALRCCFPSEYIRCGHPQTATSSKAQTVWSLWLTKRVLNIIW